ncbi:hypothetical protein PIB30_049684 [Stylosanthes scabra]|uniref:F-box associated domain-containing protein n=1 Tax=Stylosanthes scabra TaxID=79078 RepID=A0ABU6WFG9_9FABA|nr:hypothetical protein [Stylosanthes scabra]
MTVVVGIGPPPNDDISQWFIQANVRNGHQDLFRVPHEINHYGSYTLVGSDNGIVCMRVSIVGFNPTLLIWSPLKQTHRYVTDQASKYQFCSMNVLAFGFLRDSVHYRILHVFKIGGSYVVNEGTIYWIGWDGHMCREPHRIVMFCLLTREFSEFAVPDHVQSEYHSLIEFNGGVRFMGNRNNGFMQTAVVWRYTVIDGQHLTWNKDIVVGGMEIPYSPSFFVGKDPVSVIEVRQNGKGSSNDDERTQIIISKLRFLPRRRELMHEHH